MITPHTTPHITHLALHVAGLDACIGFYRDFCGMEAARSGPAGALRLVWMAAWDEPFPVGYYCGLRDPNGNYVEFSYGQPLGPGTEALGLLAR